jgi:hypothetical protein
MHSRGRSRGLWFWLRVMAAGVVVSSTATVASSGGHVASVTADAGTCPAALSRVPVRSGHAAAPIAGRNIGPLRAARRRWRVVPAPKDAKHLDAPLAALLVAREDGDHTRYQTQNGVGAEVRHNGQQSNRRQP